MTRKGYLLCLATIILLAILSDSINQSLPCTNGIFVNGCEFGRFIIRAIVVIIVLNFSVISLLSGLIFIRKYKTTSLKSTFLICFLSLIISVALFPVEGYIIIRTVNTVAQNQFEADLKGVRENYTLSNFNESPIVDKATGKYKGINISLTLTTKKPDHYLGGVWLTDPNRNDKGSVTQLFGDPQRSGLDVVFEYVTNSSNESHNFSLVLEPNKFFYDLRPNGPFAVTILLEPKVNADMIGNYFTGDQYYLRYSSSVISYMKELITKPYLFSDFR